MRGDGQQVGTPQPAGVFSESWYVAKPTHPSAQPPVRFGKLSRLLSESLAQNDQGEVNPSIDQRI
jgi:hypothetical protein